MTDLSTSHISPTHVVPPPRRSLREVNVTVSSDQPVEAGRTGPNSPEAPDPGMDSEP